MYSEQILQMQTKAANAPTGNVFDCPECGCVVIECEECWGLVCVGWEVESQRAPLINHTLSKAFPFLGF